MAPKIALKPKDWPAGLKEIPQPPKQLWLEGQLPNFEDYHYLTVVGSRRYSSYGREVCEKLVAGLAGYSICIVSGLALGIDAIAHRAALRANLPTLGVPGSGLDRSVLYPVSHRRLADEIVERGGGLLSEFDHKQVATLYTFPQRNRIMAGLSQMVLIIEAAEKSGTLITARMALDYNRIVGAVPGSIFSLASRGANWLIRAGATPTTSSEDILNELGLETGSEKAPSGQPEDLSAPEKKVWEWLQIEPLPRDIIISKLKLPIGEANSLLVMMEIKGLIKEELGEVGLV